MLFGGLGNNFINPALAARAFLLVSFPVRMTTWTVAFNAPLQNAADAVTSATPLMLIKQGSAAFEGSSGALSDFMRLFLGNVGGSIGEVSALALLIDRCDDYG